MADYTAPFHMPTFSDDEFLAKKESYVAEHGYSVTIPRFSDVVHLGMHRPMSDQEKIYMYSGQSHKIGKARQIELQYQKERSRERYQKMMASPIPNVVASITSVLTAIDDAQDAIISLAAIGRIACLVLPRFIAGFLAWPVGLLWFIATIMGLLIAPSACALNPMACKKYMRLKLAMREKTLKGKSRSLGKRAKNLAKYQKARLAAGLKGYASYGTVMPSFAEGIQMLQVTDSIFGVGVSIGPLFGCAYDLISGGVRWAAGQKVTFKNAPSDIEVYRKAADTVNEYARWTRPATKFTKAEFLAWKAKKVASGTWGVQSQQHNAIFQANRLHEHNYGFNRHTDWIEETLLYTNAEIAAQGIQSTLDHWDPVLNIEGSEHIEIEAYNEPNPLIEEMLAEEGVNYEDHIGWPSLGKRWATYEELQTSIAPIAAQNIAYFSENCPDDRLKAIAEMSATNCGLLTISLALGAEWIEIQHHAAIDIGEMLLDQGYSFPLNITGDQIISFALWTQECEDANRRPSLIEVLAYAKNSLGFDFTTSP